MFSPKNTECWNLFDFVFHPFYEGGGGGGGACGGSNSKNKM